MSTEDDVTRLPVDGEQLWTATVEPNAEGSGTLPPNPTFSTETPPTHPEIETLLESFSPPAIIDYLPDKFP